MATVAEVLVETLVRAGVRRVLGVGPRLPLAVEQQIALLLGVLLLGDVAGDRQ